MKVLTTSARDWARQTPVQQEKLELPAIKRVARPPTSMQLIRAQRDEDIEGED